MTRHLTFHHFLATAPRPHHMASSMGQWDQRSNAMTHDGSRCCVRISSIRKGLFIGLCGIVITGLAGFSSRIGASRTLANGVSSVSISVSVKDDYETRTTLNGTSKGIGNSTFSPYNVSFVGGKHSSGLNPNAPVNANGLHSSAANRTGPDDNETRPMTLDFFISGFPKCGTTTIQDALRVHNEIAMPEGESNIFTTPGDDKVIFENVMKELQSLSPELAHVKRGIKTPMGLGTGINSLRAVGRLERLYPNVKLIFGLRHPISWFESFYNYRVWNHYEGDSFASGSIPSAESLLSESWASVSVDSARFENVLKNLRKTNKEKATPFKVFLYTIEQLQDREEVRKAAFRDSLASFLELKDPLPPLPHSNKLQAVHNETIDICNDKFMNLRRTLVDNGKETKQWILEQFIESPDVTVANKGHFRELMETFGSDPCVDSVE
jgi:hypothetical protein